VGSSKTSVTVASTAVYGWTKVEPCLLSFTAATMVVEDVATHQGQWEPPYTQSQQCTFKRRRRTAANACAIIRIARVFKAEHLVAVSTSPRPIQTSWAPELELTRPISLLEPLEHSLSASQKPFLTCADGRISSLVSLDLRVFAPLRLFACLTFPIMLCGQFAVGVAAYLHSKVCL